MKNERQSKEPQQGKNRTRASIPDEAAVAARSHGKRQKKQLHKKDGR
jgi:hypothetical protein